MAKRIAAADARRDFSEVVQQSSRGERIKLTRYGKTQAVLISARDLERLEDCETAKKPAAKTGTDDAPAPQASRR
jgi:prevent-host-death family protein